MKKFLAIILFLFLFQPLALFAQTNDASQTAIDQFCSNKNEQGVLLRKNVTSVNQFCANTNTCVELVDALHDLGKVEKELVAEKDREKAAELQTSITSFRSAVTEKQKVCGEIENLVVNNEKAQVAEIKSRVAEMAKDDDGKLLGCVRIDQADTTVQECLREDGEFAALQNAILFGNLVTILEEPISKENVYDRARICELDFVRNNKGELQPVKDAPGHYAIKPAECRTYIVANCIPTRSNVSSVVIEGDKLTVAGEVTDHLPVVVYCDRVQAIWADSGVNLLKKYVGLIYRWATGIVGVIAVLVIMVSGIQISAAGGDSAKIDEAKGRITQSIIALAVLFLSGIILYAINPTFFTSGDPQVRPEQQDVGDSVIDDNLPSQTNEDLDQREADEAFEDSGSFR